MTGRQLNESTQAWLERLISINAPDVIIGAVTAILQREPVGSISISKYNTTFVFNNYYYQLPLQAKFSIETTAPTDIILLISTFSFD